MIISNSEKISEVNVSQSMTSDIIGVLGFYVLITEY